ncbi:MAG: protein YgfX, partial [Halofilum sp. (in: g-proteobacteria)]
MSSPAFDAPLTLELQPSAALRASLIALHVLAAVGLLVLPAAWLVAGALVLGVSLALEWRRAGRHHCLHWRADGGWEQPGATGVSQLHRSTFVSRWLIVLALHDGRRVRRWAICADAVAVPTWRRLRARLGVQGPALAGVQQESA